MQHWQDGTGLPSKLPTLHVLQHAFHTVHWLSTALSVWPYYQFAMQDWHCNVSVMPAFSGSSWTQRWAGCTSKRPQGGSLNVHGLVGDYFGIPAISFLSQKYQNSSRPLLSLSSSSVYGSKNAFFSPFICKWAVAPQGFLEEVPIFQQDQYKMVKD